MALMNDNRLRIPQVSTLPASGDDDSIRGQLRMIDVDGDTAIMVCTTGDNQSTSELAIGASTAILTYTSIPTGDAGELVTITHTLTGGALTITVTGNDIVIDGITGGATTTAADVVAAIALDATASALVTVVDDGDAGAGFIGAAGIANLAGGAGTKAAVTVNGSLVVTAAASGKAGNDITIEVVDVTGAAYATATATFNAIVVTGDSATHDTADLANAININSNTNKLVSAAGSADAVATVAATNLTGGISLSVWTSMAVA